MFLDKFIQYAFYFYLRKSFLQNFHDSQNKHSIVEISISFKCFVRETPVFLRNSFQNCPYFYFGVILTSTES